EWVIPMIDIAVDGRRLHLCNDTCSALVDTGTSLVVGPVHSSIELMGALETDDCRGPNVVQKSASCYSDPACAGVNERCS
ncbi:conserved hypothetical protein, partial [Perkinsus marinus ATCC 50983]